MFDCYTSKVTRLNSTIITPEPSFETKTSNIKNLFRTLYDGSIIAEFTKNNMLCKNYNIIDNIKLAAFFDLAIKYLFSPKKIKLKTNEWYISKSKYILTDCNLFIRAKIISKNIDACKYLCELADNKEIYISEIGTVRTITNN